MQPWNPAAHHETWTPAPALPSLACDSGQDLGPLPFPKGLSSLISVASGFPWDLVCLSAGPESWTSSHPILLVTTKGCFPGSGDGGQGLRILVLSVAVKAGAGLGYSPADPS